ncbi:MAG: hypothetical protein JO127_10120 [Caulobacteraceae bacterium]|nr:hypothetical protein [Caulobacteraceae bacterium]
MRRIFLLFAAVPAVALAAGPTASRYQVPAPQAQRDTLSPALQASAPAAQPVAVRAAAEPADCRMSCAQSYYFCRAGDDPDGCAPTWSACVAACASPDLAAAVPGRP